MKKNNSKIIKAYTPKDFEKVSLNKTKIFKSKNVEDLIYLQNIKKLSDKEIEYKLEFETISKPMKELLKKELKNRKK